MSISHWRQLTLGDQQFLFYFMTPPPFAPWLPTTPHLLDILQGGHKNLYFKNNFCNMMMSYELHETPPRPTHTHITTYLLHITPSPTPHTKIQSQVLVISISRDHFNDHFSVDSTSACYPKFHFIMFSLSIIIYLFPLLLVTLKFSSFARHKDQSAEL